MSDTLFTQIINGTIPSHKIYEDDSTYAFMDIHPVRPYHVLVIPKNPVEFVWDLPEADYQSLMSSVQKVALRLREVTGQPYVHARITGVDVPHAHVQLIPFASSSELAHEASVAEPDHSALAAQAAELAF